MDKKSLSERDICIEIDEIGDPTVQGVTRPLRCMGQDGAAYFVKTAGNAGPRSLVCEWVAGRLAQALGLPVAPFAQVHLDEGLTQAHARLTGLRVAAGEAFGSREVPQVRDMDPTLLRHCTSDFRQALVAFDWWVRNADRTLTDRGGNPNLLWAAATPARPVVIDHNQAFDVAFDAPAFADTHVCRADFEAIRADLLLREEHRQRFTKALTGFADIWAELPQNWTHDEQGAARFDPVAFLDILQAVCRDDFWHLPSRPTSP